MRLDKPRVDPLPKSEWDADVASRLGDNPLNVLKTLANHPKLYKRWAVFANHIFARNSLPDRERELLMLRIGWLCQSEYEFGQHTLIGKDCGLTDSEILAVTKGADAGWNEADATLITMADELHADAFVSDATWAKLGERYTTEQMMDAVFTVGQYNMVSMALNTLGVQLDEGVPGWPAGSNPTG